MQSVEMMSHALKPDAKVQYAPLEGETLRTKKRSGLQPFVKGWFWEIASMLVSFGCSLAVVIILLKMQDRPLSSWTFYISLNATVAACITAAKSSAMLFIGSCLGQLKWLHFKSSMRRLRDLDLFDEASRGPWGSVVLLFRLRWKGGLAAIGALATILALGFDAIVQEVITLDIRDVVSHGANNASAAFGLSHHYDGGTQSYAAGGDTYTPVSDPGMQGAIYRGIYNTSTSIPFTCPSQCNWPDTYYSLGFTSHCENVTKETLDTLRSSFDNKTSTQSYILTAPSGTVLWMNYSGTMWQSTVNVVATDLLYEGKTGSGWDDPIPSDIARMSVIRAPLDVLSFAIDPKALEVVECTVSFAAFATTNVTASGNNLTVGRTDVIPLKNGTWKTVQPTPQQWSKTIVFNHTGLPDLSARAPDIGAIRGLFMSNRFMGAIYDGEEPLPAEPQGIGVALKKGDISLAVGNMVDSMTNQLRSMYQTTAYGEPVEQIVFVAVKWEWLALPAVVQVAALVLLISTIIRNWGSRSRLWKSSTVAVLYHNLLLRTPDGDEGFLQAAVMSKEELEWKAKRVKAGLLKEM